MYQVHFRGREMYLVHFLQASSRKIAGRLPIFGTSHFHSETRALRIHSEGAVRSAATQIRVSPRSVATSSYSIASLR